MMKNLRLVKVVYVPKQGFGNEELNERTIIKTGSQTPVWELHKGKDYA